MQKITISELEQEISLRRFILGGMCEDHPQRWLAEFDLADCQDELNQARREALPVVTSPDPRIARIAELVAIREAAEAELARLYAH